MKEVETKGTTTVWEGLEQARKERWEQLEPHSFHCKKHNTYFDPDGYLENDYEDAEPCWACYNEFEIVL